MPKRFSSPVAKACVAFTIVLFAALPALAHKVNIFAYVESNVVYTESYFPDGKTVADGSIEVITPSGEILAQGKTDQEGNFSFPLPAQQEDLTIVLNASMGHKSTFLLKKEEM